MAWIEEKEEGKLVAEEVGGGQGLVDADDDARGDVRLQGSVDSLYSMCMYRGFLFNGLTTCINKPKAASV